MLHDDRRKFQRLRLSKPILATARGQNALVLDIGVAGAFLEHYGTAESGDKFQLSFKWKGDEVELACEVVRSFVVRERGGDGANIVSHTGVRFLEAVGDSMAKLQDLIATFVGRVLAAQKANASGEAAGAAILSQLGNARRTRSRGYVSYRLKDERWWRIPTTSARQPADGFTVSTHEDEEEVESLCRAYEYADEEGRRLIRLVAELSVSPPEI
jgi:hypothetical protein